MPWIVGGLIVAGTVGGGLVQGYFGNQGAEAQADAMKAAAEKQADAAVASARISANASRQSMAMQAEAMRDAAGMQQDIARQSMQHAERMAVREELRAVTGQAAKDTFDRVASAFVSWAQGNDIQEEQRLLEQFGLENESGLQPPPQDPSLWEMMNTDLLTGDTTTDDNPYRLENDLGREFDNEMNRLYPDEGPQTPPSPADGPSDYPAPADPNDPERDQSTPEGLLDEAEELSDEAGDLVGAPETDDE